MTTARQGFIIIVILLLGGINLTAPTSIENSIKVNVQEDRIGQVNLIDYQSSSQVIVFLVRDGDIYSIISFTEEAEYRVDLPITTKTFSSGEIQLLETETNPSIGIVFYDEISNYYHLLAYDMFLNFKGAYQSQVPRELIVSTFILRSCGSLCGFIAMTNTTSFDTHMYRINSALNISEKLPYTFNSYRYLGIQPYMDGYILLVANLSQIVSIFNYSANNISFIMRSRSVFTPERLFDTKMYAFDSSSHLILTNTTHQLLYNIVLYPAFVEIIHIRSFARNSDILFQDYYLSNLSKYDSLTLSTFITTSNFKISATDETEFDLEFVPEKDDLGYILLPISIKNTELDYFSYSYLILSNSLTLKTVTIRLQGDYSTIFPNTLQLITQYLRPFIEYVITPLLIILGLSVMVSILLFNYLSVRVIEQYYNRFKLNIKNKSNNSDLFQLIFGSIDYVRNIVMDRIVSTTESKSSTEVIDR